MELAARLQEALHDGSTRARLASAGEAFEAQHARAADGKASERVAREILALLGEKQ